MNVVVCRSYCSTLKYVSVLMPAVIFPVQFIYLQYPHRHGLSKFSKAFNNFLKMPNYAGINQFAQLYQRFLFLFIETISHDVVFYGLAYAAPNQVSVHTPAVIFPIQFNYLQNRQLNRDGRPEFSKAFNNSLERLNHGINQFA